MFRASEPQVDISADDRAAVAPGARERLDELLAPLVEMIDHLALGLIIADGLGAVRFSNRAAADLLDAAHGLRMRGGHLCAARGDDSARLTQGIARAAGRAPHRLRTDRWQALTVADAGARTRQLLLIASLQRAGRAEAADGRLAALYLADLGRHAGPAPDVLAHLFGLTTAEANVAARLLEGRTLPEAAAEMNVSHNTVRTHLKHIFEKTGTTRQGQLLRILAMGPCALRTGD